MKRTSTLLLFWSFFFVLLINTAGAQVSTRDSLALVDFYNSTGGSGWKYSANWLTAAPVASWDGVVVEKGRVTGIYLTSNNTQGHIPASFGNLDSLVNLYLSDNNLQGGLPPSFTKLTHLQTLVLGNNPNLGAKLTPAFGNLVSLQDVQMGVTGTTGSIPKEIGQLTHLLNLDFNTCKLTGSLPPSLAKLLQLLTINLSSNDLSGRFPDSFATLPNLTNLDLSNNHFSGPLPVTGDIPQLFSLVLSNNKFSGPLPRWLGNCKQLFVINVSNNQFTGRIPDELSTLPELYAMTLRYNHFSGAIPEWAFDKPSLVDVFLDHNEFSQPQNPCIQLGPGLDYLDVSYNHYTFNGLECITADKFFHVIVPQATIPIHAYGNGLAVSAGGTLSNNTYKWYRAGGTGIHTIVGDSTFTPQQSGSYYAKVINAAVATLTLYTDTLAYTKPAPPVALLVYPNPARNHILITGLDAGANAKITVADVTGYVWMTTLSHQQSTTQMDVSRLKGGSYLLTINDGKELRTISFVKE